MRLPLLIFLFLFLSPVFAQEQDYFKDFIDKYSIELTSLCMAVILAYFISLAFSKLEKAGLKTDNRVFAIFIVVFFIIIYTSKLYVFFLSFFFYLMFAALLLIMFMIRSFFIENLKDATLGNALAVIGIFFLLIFTIITGYYLWPISIPLLFALFYFISETAKSQKGHEETLDDDEIAGEGEEEGEGITSGEEEKELEEVLKKMIEALKGGGS